MKNFQALGRTIAQLYRLACLCGGGTGWQVGLLFCVLILAANIADVYIGVVFISWYKDFYDALEKVDVSATVHQVGIFFMLTAVSASIYLAGQYIQKILLMRWRLRLNSIVLNAWLSNKTYWKLRPGFSEDHIENPDQRIADDCRLFVKALLQETIGLISRVIGLFTYLWVLWSLSSFPLQFTLFETEITIPRYMVWAAFLYVILSSFLTHKLGAPLKNLLFAQQRREADYRYALARIRDSADAVALANGEEAERRLLDRRFQGIMDNWYRMIVREFILGLFSRPYFQTVLRIPLFLALPAYLAGRLTLGGLMQVSQAFSSVVTSLSWFIFRYKDLSDWVATSNRLSEFLDKANTAHGLEANIQHVPNGTSVLQLSNFRLQTPRGDILQLPETLSIQAGERIWLNGNSGVGKSTLLKALAGIWPFGSGLVEHPAGWKPVFMSQEIYLPLCNLQENASYPIAPTELPQGQLDKLIKAVGLEHRAGQFDIEGSESVDGLSGGEKQRLAFLRILAAEPDWIFLDESTSALDETSEKQLIKLLIHSLPEATIILVSHKKPSLDVNWREVTIAPELTLNRLSKSGQFQTV